MKYTVVVQQDIEDGGYYAYVPELQGCYTQGETLDLLRENIKEAIEVSTEEKPLNNQNFIGIWEMEVSNEITASY